MIITDSGFWVALVNPDDKHHQIAINTLATINEPLITTYPVMTEVGESLFLRKLVLGIPAQASSKNLTRPLMPPAAPIRPRHLVPTQQGVGT
ncbi:toxin [Bathymodiolus japonicus methanotrophic gill symbiont]|nr:toxin [Bathymodiolus japonicus methanotrophic gill symbiont]